MASFKLPTVTAPLARGDAQARDVKAPVETVRVETPAPPNVDPGSPPSPIGALPKAEQSAQLQGMQKPMGASKPWELQSAAMTSSSTSPDVAKALLAVMAGLPIDLLTEPVRDAVQKLLDSPQGAPNANAKGPAKTKLVFEAAKGALTEATVRSALHDLVVAANDLSMATVTGLNQSKLHDFADAKGGETRNFHRTWGLSLLPHDDPAFRAPEYLISLNQESGQVRSNNSGAIGSPSGARAQFLEEWRKNSPGTKPIALCDSGSDAVSLCFDIARKAGRARMAEKMDINARSELKKAPMGGYVMPHVEPKLAFFEGSYGGGRGVATGIAWEEYNKDIAPDLSKDALPSPVSTSRNPTDAAELARLKPIEDAAMAKLEAMCANDNPPLGAVFLEPILGSKGVLFFRDEFLLRVRALADEHRVPLILDEVLTGGGRAGSFFFYEQIKGFTPDYVTFGKGLQAAGVAAVQRPNMYGAPQTANRNNVGLTTIDGDSTRMLKAMQVMKRVREGGLLAQSKDVGAYLVEQLRAVQVEAGLPPDASGEGMLIASSGLRPFYKSVGIPTTAEGGARERLMPPLTLTREDVDGIIHDLREAIAKKQHEDAGSKRP